MVLGSAHPQGLSAAVLERLLWLSHQAGKLGFAHGAVTVSRHDCFELAEYLPSTFQHLVVAASVASGETRHQRQDQVLIKSPCDLRMPDTIQIPFGNAHTPDVSPKELLRIAAGRG